MLIRTLFFGLCVQASGLAAQTQDAPLSAIDWLSQPGLQSITENPGPAPDTSSGAVTHAVEVMELDGDDTRTTGLIPAHLSGIPKGFWLDQSVAEIRTATNGVPRPSLPAGHDLFLRILLSEVEGDDALLAARAQALIDRGAVQAAHNLLGQVQIDNAVLFAPYMETSLLTSNYDAMCQALLTNRKMSDSDALYVFCLSRTSDWDKALLNFFSLDTLGAFDPMIADLLAADLDPELAEDLTLPPVNIATLDVLEFRLRESVGLPVPTQSLPLRFAVSDLRDVSGWKSKIEAAERLAAMGSLPAAQLIGYYSEGRKSASGGVWERVAAVQAFVQADGGVADFNTLWKTSAAKNLAPIIARGLAPDLATAQADATNQTAKARFLALAQKPALSFDAHLEQLGLFESQADLPQIKQIKDVLATPTDAALALTSTHVLRGLDLVSDGLDGDFNAFLAALDLFASMGMHPIAQQLAIEYVILELGV